MARLLLLLLLLTLVHGGRGSGDVSCRVVGRQRILLTQHFAALAT